MIIPVFRLEAVQRKMPDFVSGLLAKGKRTGDFLNIRDGNYYDVAKSHNIEHLEAKQIATGQSKLAIAARMGIGFGATMARTAVTAAQGKPAMCTPEQRQARMTICAGDVTRGIEPCQFFIQSEQRCSECGCPKQSRLLDKWDFVQSACPKRKWPIL